MSCYAAQATPTVAQLVRGHGLELVRFAYLLCGDRHVAEDLVQDVVLQMYRRFPEELKIDRPVAYARRAVVNANISRARRASSTEIAVALVPERIDLSLVDAAPGEHDWLWQAVRRLPPRQRAVLVLRYYADASDEEIAASLGCRRGTVRSMASRALAALRDDPMIVDGGGS